MLVYWHILLQSRHIIFDEIGMNFNNVSFQIGPEDNCLNKFSPTRNPLFAFIKGSVDPLKFFLNFSA